MILVTALPTQGKAVIITDDEKVASPAPRIFVIRDGLVAKAWVMEG